MSVIECIHIVSALQTSSVKELELELDDLSPESIKAVEQQNKHLKIIYSSTLLEKIKEAKRLEEKLAAERRLDEQRKDNDLSDEELMRKYQTDYHRAELAKVKAAGFEVDKTIEANIPQLKKPSSENFQFFRSSSLNLDPVEFKSTLTSQHRPRIVKY